MTSVRLLSFIALAAIFCAQDALLAAADPLFDFDAITKDPLDARVTKSTESEGIVAEEIEFTGAEGQRITGLLAYPKGGTNLPAIFWSQSGMYAASDYFPKLFA